ncbi:hypothetical protein ACD591_03860 [Rufibacter glacialis]|nr:hypothetical protein [Rufibacter glacialis]
MDKMELKKPNGDVYFEAWRLSDNSCIKVNWIGIQSLETVVMGGNLVLTMLREKSCPAILNSNRELIGPWESSANYMAQKWAPSAKRLGLQYFAHVLSPGIFGRRSFDLFLQLLTTPLTVKSFEDEETADAWLFLHHSS